MDFQQFLDAKFPGKSFTVSEVTLMRIAYNQGWTNGYNQGKNDPDFDNTPEDEV